MAKFITIIILTSTIFLNAYSQNINPPTAIIVGDTPLNYGIIFPLGWSNDGKFAYIIQDINNLSISNRLKYDFIIL